MKAVAIDDRTAHRAHLAPRMRPRRVAAVAADDQRLQQDHDSRHSADQLLGVTARVVALLVATAIVFIVWMWRSAKNNEISAGPATHTCGWSIGGWFIPIGNLWIPVQIMQDLWQGSDPTVSGHRDRRDLRDHR